MVNVSSEEGNYYFVSSIMDMDIENYKDFNHKLSKINDTPAAGLDAFQSS